MKIRTAAILVAGQLFWGGLQVLDARAAEGSFDRTLKVTGPVDLEVTTGSGRIQVRTGGDGVVQVHGFIRAHEGLWGDASEKVRYLQDNPPIEQTGNVIRIGRIDDMRYRQNVSISYELIVPAETRLQSKTGSGSQTIEGVRGSVTASSGSGHLTLSEIGGMVRAHTGSGGINLDGAQGSVDLSTGSGSIRALQVAGGIRADTGSGDVTLAQSAPGDVDVQTGSGGIEVSGIRGSFRARTGSGHITAAGTPSGEWNAHAASGGITVTLESTSGFELYAHTSSGRVTVNHPVTVQGSFSTKEIRGRVRNGGPMLELRTGSGNIVVQ